MDGVEMMMTMTTTTIGSIYCLATVRVYIPVRVVRVGVDICARAWSRHRVRQQLPMHTGRRPAATNAAVS